MQNRSFDKEKKKNLYSSQDAFSLLIEAYREIENFRDQTELEATRNRKAQSLLDLIEAMCSVDSGRKDISKVIEEKLSQIVDAVAMEYGGAVFLAPIDIPQNASLGGKNKDDFNTDLSTMEFIQYVWSTSTSALLERMKGQLLDFPRLSRAQNFQLILLSKRFKILDTSLIHLPEGHFDLKTCLLVPIVVNKQSVALLGMANGTYNRVDGEILMDVLPKVWTNIILESVAKANKQLENIERFKRVEQKIEATKKMTLALTNAMKSEEEDSSFVSKKKYLHKKLKDMANFFESQFGGMIFVAPTKVATNLSLMQYQILQGTSSSSSDSTSETEEKPDPYKFMNYVFSDSAQTIRKTVMKSFKKPVLLKTKHMLNCVKTGQVLYLPNASAVELPPGHFPLTSLLVVPIMQNNECVALLGCANGKYAEMDAEVVQDVLSTSWFTLMQEIFSRMKEKITTHKGLTLVDKIAQSIVVVVRIQGLNEILSAETTNYRNVLEFINMAYQKFYEMCATSGIHRVICRGKDMLSVAPFNQLLLDCYAKILLILSKFVDGMKEKQPIFKAVQLQMLLAGGEPVICGAFGRESTTEFMGEFLEKSISKAATVPGGRILVDGPSYEVLKDKTYSFQKAENDKDHFLIDTK